MPALTLALALALARSLARCPLRAAADSLLMRLPNLESLHLGNNQLDSAQAVALAASITRHRVSRLCNLTLGSNDIGDVGLAAILKALPPTMKQLYLHGCDIHDAGLESLRIALEKMPDGEGGQRGGREGGRGSAGERIVRTACARVCESGTTTAGPLAALLLAL